MAFDDARVLAQAINAKDPAAVQTLLSQIAGYIDNPVADLRITPEAATASPRSVTFQVRDRANQPWKGRFLLLVMFGNTEWDTSATQTFIATVGAVSLELVADRIALCWTDANGTLTLDVTSAPGTRYATAVFLGRAQSSGAIAVT